MVAAANLSVFDLVPRFSSTIDGREFKKSDRDRFRDRVPADVMSIAVVKSSSKGHSRVGHPFSSIDF